MAAALTNQAWADICAAAGGTPGDGARTEVEAVLFVEYPAFTFDRERVIAAQERAERMLKHLDAFAELYWQAWLPDLPADQFQAVLAGLASVHADDVKTQAHFWSIQMLRRRALSVCLYASAIRRANARHSSAQREMLYHRLCTVWLDHFHPELTYSRPSGGGAPRGPLVAFMFAAMRKIMPEDGLPSPETVGDAIDRERVDRAHLRDEVRQWKERRRDMGMGS